MGWSGRIEESQTGARTEAWQASYMCWNWWWSCLEPWPPNPVGVFRNKEVELVGELWMDCVIWMISDSNSIDDKIWWIAAWPGYVYWMHWCVIACLF